VVTLFATAGAFGRTGWLHAGSGSAFAAPVTTAATGGSSLAGGYLTNGWVVSTSTIAGQIDGVTQGSGASSTFMATAAFLDTLVNLTDADTDYGTDAGTVHTKGMSAALADTGTSTSHESPGPAHVRDSDATSTEFDHALLAVIVTSATPGLTVDAEHPRYVLASGDLGASLDRITGTIPLTGVEESSGTDIDHAIAAVVVTTSMPGHTADAERVALLFHSDDASVAADAARIAAHLAATEPGHSLDAVIRMAVLNAEEGRTLDHARLPDFEGLGPFCIAEVTRIEFAIAEAPDLAYALAESPSIAYAITEEIEVC
jgi:hypothetical protein